ncbi:MAG: hypothetical protein U0353_11685 [Sandaracinus sp.]
MRNDMPRSLPSLRARCRMPEPRDDREADPRGEIAVRERPVPSELERASFSGGQLRGAALRAALLAVEPSSRDAWIDALLGLGEIPEDGPSLPRGGVPYLPCDVSAILSAIDLVTLDARRTFVDLGAGVGRAAMLVHLLTGARAIGVEVQPELVAHADATLARLQLGGISMRCADVRSVALEGDVFFLYAPFSGAILDEVTRVLAALGARRPIEVITVDLELALDPACVLDVAGSGRVTRYALGPRS